MKLLSLFFMWLIAMFASAKISGDDGAKSFFGTVIMLFVVAALFVWMGFISWIFIIPAVILGCILLGIVMIFIFSFVSAKKPEEAEKNKQTSNIKENKITGIQCVACEKYTADGFECEYRGFCLKKNKLLNDKLKKAYTADMLKIVIGGVLCAGAVIGFFASLITLGDNFGFFFVPLIVGIIVCNLGYSNSNGDGINLGATSREKAKKEVSQEIRIFENMKRNAIKRISRV